MQQQPVHHLSCDKYSNGFLKPFVGLALALLLLAFLPPTSSCSEQERSSLLQFLTGLSQDGGLALSWQNGTDCCAWEGVGCGMDGTVTDVSLALKGLEGHISASLGELTGLLRLNLSHNLLFGGLPMELMSSNSIVVLDVSFNRLSGGLHELPSSTPRRPLQVLNISTNLFTGEFPSTTWEVMTSLVALNASNNSFTGQIPSHLCSSSPALAVIALCYNQLSGLIPPELGNCSMLKVLKAGHNALSGSLPDELFNATSLEYLSFPNNGLHGILDSEHIINLRNLAHLDLGGNRLNGNIPDSIGQLKRLEELHLNNNNMSGELPSTLSNCTNLITIDLKVNNFGGELQKVNFFSLPNLKTLDLLYNNFTGTIPESIYSCSKLNALRLSSNNLHGQLSPRIANLRHLVFLSLVSNNFTNITNTLQILKNCRNLTSLLIGSNFKGEDMPEDETIDGFQNLQVLSMSNCSLSGKIPLWLSKLKNLQVLLLHTNQLSGPIPAWIKSLKSLFHLDISSNKFTGDIPTALMEMPMLTTEKTATHLDPRVFELPVYKNPSLQYRITSALPKLLKLGYNNFTGVIPQEIGQLKSLAVLNFSSNGLSGEIPLELCNLTNLQVLDLSNNHLSGTIPSALNNLHFLSTLNISYNNLEGPIPNGGQFSTFSNSSFEGNPKLCGPILLHSCSSAVAPTASTEQHSRKAIFGIAFGVFFGVVLILLLVYLTASFKGKSLINKSKTYNNEDVEATSHMSDSEQSLVIVPRGEGKENKLKFADIVRATNNFHQGNIIGCGGYGLVYKAILPDGTKLAIKKLNGEMWTMEREFKAEVEALSMAQHENLVPLWGYCIQGDSRLLIYSYMENGSLDDWLHNIDDGASTFLNWPMRLKIAQGASRGLSYIHDVCKPHIVHRDIKSSNILLDKEFKAYVADFGLSRLVHANNTHVTTELVGTLGYIPPEYGQGWVATLRGDMYSFGVVLLELLTGRRPVTGLSLSKELVKWVKEMKSEGKQIEILDPHLRGIGHDEQMLKVLEIACKCVDHNACMRPTILEVVSCLDSIEPTLRMQNSVRI
ncbi:hypothetical protein BDA96_04G049200 [Sorghum bicolor]|jgi:Leucine-rich repeat (LRR) protein|uniref:non-specific serine/threonine protein kinase n=1 Tax=Sorghum bicolor TaxID=4558 RepID=A0A921R143_SORBI|nr:hypothetical protein BDA96_04G049200 [Sorghum bicolor]